MSQSDSAAIHGSREADEPLGSPQGGALVANLPDPSGRSSTSFAGGTLPASAPLGQAPPAVRAWFDGIAAAARPENDGSLAAAHDSARAYRSRAKADNTRAAYRSAVRAWCAWCLKHGVQSLPASSADVAAFLAADRDGGKAGNTLRLRAAAIRFLHRAAGLPSPTDTAEVSETMAGIRRDAPNPKKKRAATLVVLREILAPIPDDLRGLRDRALLLAGFAGALRRSELAAITCADLQPTDRGYELTLPRSKGAQTEAVLVPLPYGRTELCPVRALSRWLQFAAITEGPVFRRIWLPPQVNPDAPPPLPALGREALTTRSIGRIVQSRAADAGFVARDFGGHSLKRGALTTGMQGGAHPAKLRRLGRHKSFDMLGEYLEFGDLFDAHPLGGVL
jgi:integrase